MTDVAELSEHFRALGSDHRNRSPLHAHLCSAAADDPEIVALLQAAPQDQQLPVLLMAAVHSIVLAEPDLELAAYYPSVTEAPRAGDAFPAFRALCHRRADELRRIVAHRQVQTNEVGRSAIFLPALAQIADAVGPIGLLDVGASAGLNLQLDRFEYHYSPGGDVGGPSPVVVRTATRGEVPVPAVVPAISARLGIDRSPIDAADADDARWLMACVWPDQRDRFERMRDALALAREHPVAVCRSDAVDGLRAAVDEVASAGHPVVLNSWVLNYLGDDRRRAYLAELDAIGRERDLDWLYAEAPALCAGIPFGDRGDDPFITALTLTTWRAGERSTRHLAAAHPHGYWLHWHHGAPIEPS